jgi:protein CpxP
MTCTRTILKRFLIVSAIGLGLPPGAGAEPQMAGGPPHCDSMHQAMPPHPGLPPGLGLSEAQEDKVFAILHAQGPLMRDKMKQIDKARKELQTLARSDRYDETRARALAEAAARATSEMALLRAGSEHQIRELLTPEQRQKFDAAEAGPPHHGMGGHGGHGGPPPHRDHRHPKG